GRVGTIPVDSAEAESPSPGLVGSLTIGEDPAVVQSRGPEKSRRADGSERSHQSTAISRVRLGKPPAHHALVRTRRGPSPGQRRPPGKRDRSRAEPTRQ